VTATVVLVHGAWHGAWCWDLVAAGLRERGTPVVAVDLPGHGDDQGPCTDLAGDVARVRGALDGVTGSAVLVGHSYGGMPIAAAAAHPTVAHTVFIAALCPIEGETAMTMATAEAAAANVDIRGRSNPGQYMTFDDNGMASLSAEGAKFLFYNDCDDELASWAVSRLRPQPMGNLQELPATIGWRDKPSTYAVCALDNIMHRDLQRVLAQRTTNSVEWHASHSPFLSNPEVVVDLLAGIAAGVD